MWRYEIIVEQVMRVLITCKLNYSVKYMDKE
jgi:hypothetical protein